MSTDERPFDYLDRVAQEASLHARDLYHREEICARCRPGQSSILAAAPAISCISCQP